jgi:hypothetical protein
VLVSAVTAWPDGPVSLIAAAEVGAVPGGVTNTSKEVPAVGAGEHWKAHPMFQLAAVIVKAVLVQSPDDCIGPSNTRAGTVVGGDAVADVVVVVDDPVEDDPEVVVVVEEPPPLAFPPAAVVVVLPVEPLGGGGVYAPPEFDLPEPEAAPPSDS